MTDVVGELPAPLVQYSVYVSVPSASGVTVKVPLGASVPLQPVCNAAAFPDAVHELAVGEDQLMVVVVSAGMDFAPSVSVGAGGTTAAGVARRVTEVGAEGPPRLLQVSVKVSVPTAVGAIAWLPLVGSVPLQLPEAAQLVASVEDHLSVVDSPTGTEFAVNVSAGAVGGVPEVTVRVVEAAAGTPEALRQASV